MPHFITLTITPDCAKELRRFLIRLSMRVRSNPPEGWGDFAERFSATYHAIQWIIKERLDELPKAARQAGSAFDVRLLAEEMALVRYGAEFYGLDFGLPPETKTENYPDERKKLYKLLSGAAKSPSWAPAIEIVKEVNAYAG